MVYNKNNLTILRRKQVEAMTGLSRSSIYAGMDSGTFPKAIKLSARSVGWIECEIQNWLNDRITVSRGGVNHE